MIPALVLTAGMGTRLDPLTRLVAKPAVPIGGRPLVVHVLEWLHREGIRDVVLNLHHRPETITAIAGDGAHLGLRVRYSWEQPLLGSAGGPRHALPLLRSWRQPLEEPARDGPDRFLIVNGDTLCDFPLAPMIEAHVRRGAEVTMAVVPNARPESYNGVALGADHRVTGFVPRGQAEGTWHFVGVQVAEAAVFAALPDNVPAETVHGLYGQRLAAAGAAIFGWRAQTAFLDVGTPADYLKAALEWSRADPARLVAADASIDPSAAISQSIVWPGARVGAGARLDRCIVAGRALVPAGFAARDAVIVPASIVKPGEDAAVAGDVAAFRM
jgi:NDP-sugar pyrophosphorylase family protein